MTSNGLRNDKQGCGVTSMACGVAKQGATYGKQLGYGVASAGSFASTAASFLKALRMKVERYQASMYL